MLKGKTNKAKQKLRGTQETKKKADHRKDGRV